MIDYAELGAVVPGNIDLTRRPHVRNADGSVSTVVSMSFAEGGLEVLVPCVADAGHVMSSDDAIREYRRTGRHMGKYASAEAATAAAQRIEEDQQTHPPLDTLAAMRAIAGAYEPGRSLFRRDMVVQVDTLRLEGFHVSFDISKSLSAKQPNTAEVRVYNLSEEHRRQLQQLERVYVQIEAGYVGARSLVFRGQLRSATSAAERSIWVTKITSDTGRTARKARIAKSFAPGVNVQQVLQTLVEQMGVRIGNTQLHAAAARIAQTGADRFFNGYTAAGAISDELDRITRSAGLEWSIQDEEMQFLPRGQPLRELGVVLSRSTGLIGSVERGSAGLTEVRTLMLPDLFPGRRVQLDSEYVKGVYRVEATKHFGGLMDREWYVDMKLRPEERK